MLTHSLLRPPGESAESGLAYVDGVLVWNVDPSTVVNEIEPVNRCGTDTAADRAVFASIDLPDHTSSSITLRFSSTLNEAVTNEWYGISNVLIAPLAEQWPPMDTFETVRGKRLWMWGWAGGF